MRLFRGMLYIASAYVLAACSSALPTASTRQSITTPQFQAAAADGPSADLLRAGVVSVYPIGDGSSNDASPDVTLAGADGNFYFTVSPVWKGGPFPTSGIIGAFDPKTLTQKYEAVAYDPGGIYETASGSVYVEEGNNASGTPTIDKYAGIGGTDTSITFTLAHPVQNLPWNGLETDFAIGEDGELWFGSSNTGQVGEVSLTTNAVRLHTLKTPPGGVPPSSQFLTLGSDKHLWTTDANNDGVVRIVSSGPSKGANSFTALPQGFESSAFLPQGIAEGADHKLYIGNPGFPHGAFDSGVAASSPTFTSNPLPLASVDPYLVAAGKNGLMYFSDAYFGGLGIYNTTTGKMVDLPLSPPAFGSVVIDGTGAPWVMCVNASSACVERVVLTSTWHVFPSTSITLYTKDDYGNSLPPGLIGIGETGNSGPFTAVSSKTSVCTVNNIAGFDHDIQVNPVAAGKCTVTITDAHARRVSVSVTVINGSGTPQLKPALSWVRR